MAELTLSELRELLRRDEGQFLEFKSLWDQTGVTPSSLDRRKVRDAIVEYAAAFANADGGLLVLGVEDDGTVTGHSYPEEAIAEFFAAPSRRLRPPPTVRTGRATLDGREILTFGVDASPEAVMVDGNGFPYRVGDRVIREPQEVINERKSAYRRVGFERRIHPEATLADLDLDLVREARSRTIHKERSEEEFLRTYGLVVPRAGGVGITQACLLLFGRAPFTRWHPRAAVRIFRVSGEERRHGGERNVAQVARVELPLIPLIEEGRKSIASLIGRSERLHNLFFTERPEYPEFAWLEALVNAVAHRDYGDQGREIEVWFYSDRMEVKSPGGLVPPVRIEDLRERRSVHASRNPLLVRVLVEVGIMREEGEGIPRIHEEMEKSYLKAPEFEAGPTDFEVTLRNAPIFEGPSPEWQRTVRALHLGERQTRVLLAQPEGFTNDDYRRLNPGLDRDEAYRDIQELVALGIVEHPQGRGRGASYRITAALHETKGWLEARLPDLQSFFRVNPRLKNENYRSLFGLTRYAALRELKQLTDLGYLKPAGERRGSHYLPTRALEARQK